MINDLWYKNAIVYCLSVGTYLDTNADGIGDFQGLLRRLDYLQGLGVTAIWPLPSPRNSQPPIIFAFSGCRADNFSHTNFGTYWMSVLWLATHFHWLSTLTQVSVKRARLVYGLPL